MKRVLGFMAGVFVGQWLAFSAVPSPAHIHLRALQAFNQHDYVAAMRLWSEAVSLPPDNATFHYMRGRALALLGLRVSAADAYQMSLLLGPPTALAKQATEALASLEPPAAAAAGQPREVVVPLEPGLGVWITPVVVNGAHRGRFLVDTLDADRRELHLRSIAD